MYCNIQFFIQLQFHLICTVFPQDTFENFFILPLCRIIHFFEPFLLYGSECVIVRLVAVHDKNSAARPLFCIYGIAICESRNVIQYRAPCNAKFLCQFSGCNMTTDHKNTDNLQSAVCGGHCHSLLPLSPSYILNGKYVKNLPIYKNFFKFF